MRSCSTKGPKAKAGKNVSPPTIRMTDRSNRKNKKELVEKVPAEKGVVFFLASSPPTAREGRIIDILPINMTADKTRL
jgi:hypothetical protein